METIKQALKDLWELVKKIMPSLGGGPPPAK